METALQHPGLHHQSFVRKFQEKLAESRFFALSLMIHVLLVFCAGTIFFRKERIKVTDFEGSVGLIAPAEEFNPPPERLEMAMADRVTQPPPNLNSPKIDLIRTTAPTTSFKVVPAQVRVNLNITPDELARENANVPSGVPGGFENLPEAMRTRFGPGKTMAIEKTKMKPPTEQAVLRGLNWLQQNQADDGSWGDKNKGAMTGLALLCFLGHGEMPKSPQYGLTVNKAVQWFIENGTRNDGRLHMAGAFSSAGVYEHAMATYALAEFYAMTKDERVLELLKQAVGHIVKGQQPGGGWDYAYKQSGREDLSVSGWQIQALKAAHLTQLNLPGVDEALEKSMHLLSNLKGPNGGYGYTGRDDKYSLSGVGILCSLVWKGKHAELSQGMGWLLDETEGKFPVKYNGPHANLYAWYYHTQAALMFGEPARSKWNKWFQDELVNAQSPDGSWPVPAAAGAHGPQVDNSMMGAVYRTTLCVLMLETFYRYAPPAKG